jgi:hypothetical protein
VGVVGLRVLSWSAPARANTLPCAIALPVRLIDARDHREEAEEDVIAGDPVLASDPDRAVR